MFMISPIKAETNVDPQIIPGRIGYLGRFGADRGGGPLFCVGTGGTNGAQASGHNARLATKRAQMLFSNLLSRAVVAR